MAIDASQGNRTIPAEDRPLVDEAFRRAQGYGYTIGVSPDAVLHAIVGELKEGRRDMFGLVKAGRRAGLTRGD